MPDDLVSDVPVFLPVEISPENSLTAPLKDDVPVAGCVGHRGRVEIILPDGNFLFDGSQLTIDGAEGPTTITFVLNTVPEGPGTVFFSAIDTASDIAVRLEEQLPRSMDALFNLAGDGLLVLADDASGVFSVIDQPIGATNLRALQSQAFRQNARPN